MAFSAGVDSSALFYLLIENKIPFDIAIVDYGIRAQSKEEIVHAKSLAKKYTLKCYSKKAPIFKSNFEQNAREFRYRFFESLVNKHDYDNLLTAHQLNDQLEWLFMRLTKGAGVSELIGFKSTVQKDNYTLLRPLLEYSKDELLHYLHKNNYSYFIDESNTDEKHERNRFRKEFSDPLMQKYKDGIRRSFEYLKNDKEEIESTFETSCSHKELIVIKLQTISAKARAADIALKKLGYLLSAKQRKEIEKENSLVIGGIWTVEVQGDLLYIAPYIETDMPKKFKELCRVNKIPNKIRPYLFQHNIDLENIAINFHY